MNVLRKIVFVLVFSSTCFASQPQVFVWQGISFLGAGFFDGVTLNSKGQLQKGPKAKHFLSLPGSIDDIVEDGDSLYVSTSRPAQVWKVTKGQKPKVIFETDKKFITSLNITLSKKLIITVAPTGGVYFVDLSKKTKNEYVEVKEVDFLTDAVLHEDVLYFVGGSPTGKLLKMDLGSKKLTTLASVQEEALSSLKLDRRSRVVQIVMGGISSGTVYAYKNDKLRSLFQDEGEITSLVQDKKGNWFASLVETERPSGSGEPQILGSQIVRISPNGQVTALWQIPKAGINSLVLSKDEAHLYFSTSKGLLLQIKTEVAATVKVLWSEPDEVSVERLFNTKSGSILLGTAGQGKLFSWKKNTVSSESVYISPTFMMGSSSQFGSVLVDGLKQRPSFLKTYVRVGNSEKPDDTWSRWVLAGVDGNVRGLPAAMRNQVKLVWSGIGPRVKNLTVERVRISYLPFNQPPTINRLQVLSYGQKLLSQNVEAAQSAVVTLDDSAFKDVLGKPIGFAPYQEALLKANVSFQYGAQSVYVWASDPERDLLRYRFWLQPLKAKASLRTLVKDWTEEPFVTLESNKLASGNYRFEVEVDDFLTNGLNRGISSKQVSDVFEIQNSEPVFSRASAILQNKEIRLQFKVESDVPLVLVRCAFDGKTWFPVDPTDGMTDSMKENYDLRVREKALYGSVSCEAFDSQGAKARKDIKVKH